MKKNKIDKITGNIIQFMPLFFQFLNPILLRENGERFTLNGNQIKLLMILKLFSKKTSTDLSLYMDMPKGSLTTVIDSLEKKGLISRIKDERDRRKQIIELTDEGDYFTEYKNDKCFTEFQDLFKVLSDEELEKLETGFSMVVGQLMKLREKIVGKN